MLSDRGHTELPGSLPETQCDGKGCINYNFVVFACVCNVVYGTFSHLISILFLIYKHRA